MERLICLLPDTPEQNWELMADQYKASLWDIYPETQVCGIGENDTVIVDGAKAAQIQWSGFSKVRTLRKLTFKRWFFLKLVVWSPLFLIISAVLLAMFPPLMVASGYHSTSRGYAYDYILLESPGRSANIAIMVLTIFILALPGPTICGAFMVASYDRWSLASLASRDMCPSRDRSKDIWHALQQDALERRGSPLSRHRQGDAIHERTVSYGRDDNDETAPLIEPAVGDISTYPVEPIDPCSPCGECAGSGGLYCRHHPTAASCQTQSRSPMGKMKVFTLVDTFNMTATLFYAVRPPTVLVMGGREGGMKRAIACSFDITTGALYRETVLRIPSQSADRMESIPRIRLGLRRPFLDSDVRRVSHMGY